MKIERLLAIFENFLIESELPQIKESIIDSRKTLQNLNNPTTEIRDPKIAECLKDKEEPNRQISKVDAALLAFIEDLIDKELPIADTENTESEHAFVSIADKEEPALRNCRRERELPNSIKVEALENEENFVFWRTDKIDPIANESVILIQLLHTNERMLLTSCIRTKDRIESELPSFKFEIAEIPKTLEKREIPIIDKQLPTLDNPRREIELPNSIKSTFDKLLEVFAKDPIDKELPKLKQSKAEREPSVILIYRKRLCFKSLKGFTVDEEPQRTAERIEREEPSKVKSNIETSDPQKFCDRIERFFAKL